MTAHRRAARRLLLCALALAVCLAAALALVVSAERRAAAEQAQAAAASQAAAEALAAEEAARAASEAAAQAEAERLAAQAAEAERQKQAEALAAAQESVQYGDKIGAVRVEGTDVDCGLYWGDSTAQFDSGAGCHAADGCVLPGANGTVFIGAHTGTFFADLGAVETGALIELETDWGTFTYRVTEMKVINETDIDLCRWGAEEPSCILYTCYPFGILTRTTQRYAVYADPVQTDEYGVVPDAA